MSTIEKIEILDSVEVHETTKKIATFLDSQGFKELVAAAAMQTLLFQLRKRGVEIDVMEVSGATNAH